MPHSVCRGSLDLSLGAFKASTFPFYSRSFSRLVLTLLVPYSRKPRSRSLKHQVELGLKELSLLKIVVETENYKRDGIRRSYLLIVGFLGTYCLGCCKAIFSFFIESLAKNSPPLSHSPHFTRSQTRMLAAVGQLCSTSNLSRNLKIAQSLIKRAAEAKAKLLFLPEATDFIAPADQVKHLSQALDHPGGFVDSIREQARESQCWVNIGVHEKAEDGKGRCYNTNLVSELSSGRYHQAADSPNYVTAH